MSERRELILSYMQDQAANFLYYDRKEDEDLPLGAIEEAVSAGELTYADIAEAFREALENPGNHG
jgi:hypothetical protein